MFSPHAIRAIAVASDTSDLVGTVELSCEPDGLALSFLRASAYAALYAPTTVGAGRRAIVPYDRIKEVWDDGDTLRLVLEAPLVPYRRLVLAHFTRDAKVDHRVLHRRRMLAQLGVAAAASITSGALIAAASSIGTGAGALFGVLTTFAAVAGGVVLAQGMGRSAMLGGVDAENERRLFFTTLRRHLPVELVLSDPLPDSSSTVEAKPLDIRDAATGLFGEVTPTLLAAGASALVALLALFAGARLLSPSSDDSSRSTAENSTQSQGAMVTASAPLMPAPQALEESLESCLCQIPASPVVPTHVPRVSVLSSVLRARTDPKHPSLALEIAAVNNGNSSLRDIEGVVDLMTPGRKPGDPPRVHGEKGVFYEGPLQPGAAIKWHIGGRATGYRVTLKSDEMLDDGAIAPSDAFAKLLSAHTRSVRIHGATMLTRARDERALPAIEKLREDARETESDVLAALARAAAAVYSCDVEISSEGAGTAVSACVMNTGDEATGPLDAILTVSRSTPSAEEHGALASAAISTKLRVPARAGVRVHGVAETVRLDKDVVGEVVLEPSSSR